MANQQNVAGQPGSNEAVPTNTEGDPFYATSDNWDGFGENSKNTEGNSSGNPPTSDDYDDGDSARSTGYEDDTRGSAVSNKGGRRPLPESAQNDSPGAIRHTGYVLNEGERGVNVTPNIGLVGKPPGKVK